MLRAPHFCSSDLDRLDDFVVTGAATQIARQPVSDFCFRWVRVLCQQSARCNQNAGRTDSTLKRGFFDKHALQNVQVFAIRHAFDSLDLGCFRLSAEHKARTDQSAIQHDAARATIACAAPFFGPGEPEAIPQHIKKRFIWTANELFIITIDGCGNM
jgi:hypothetical protein